MAKIKAALLGKLAVSANFISAEQLAEAEAQLATLKGTPQETGLGEYLVSAGYISAAQRKQLLEGLKKSAKRLFGEIAKDWNLVTDEQIAQALAVQEQTKQTGGRPARIGQILASQDVLKAHQIKAILEEQLKKTATCRNCGASINIAQVEVGARFTCGQCQSTLVLMDNGETQLDAASTFIQAPKAIIGDYIIEQKLGADATGITYKAIQRGNNRLVSLKIYRSAVMRDVDYATRLVSELKKVSKIKHPNIKRVYAVGKAEGRTYVAMEWIEGKSLHYLLEQRGKIPPMEALAVIFTTVKALQNAWEEAEVTHGDLRPSNIVIEQESGQPKISGFGLVSKTNENILNITSSGQLAPFYIAPEQVLSERAADLRTDIYSLGAIFYHLLAGRPPFEGQSPFEVLARLTEDTYPPLSVYNNEVSAQMVAIVDKMMAAEPDERYATYGELVTDLQKVHREQERPDSLVFEEASGSVKGGTGRAAAPAAGGQTGAPRPAPMGAPGLAPMGAPAPIGVPRGAAAVRSGGGFFKTFFLLLVLGGLVYGGWYVNKYHLSPQPWMTEQDINLVDAKWRDVCERYGTPPVQPDPVLRKLLEDLRDEMHVPTKYAGDLGLFTRDFPELARRYKELDFAVRQVDQSIQSRSGDLRRAIQNEIDGHLAHATLAYSKAIEVPELIAKGEHPNPEFKNAYESPQFRDQIDALLTKTKQDVVLLAGTAFTKERTPQWNVSRSAAWGSVSSSGVSVDQMDSQYAKVLGEVDAFIAALGTHESLTGTLSLARKYREEVAAERAKAFETKTADQKGKVSTAKFAIDAAIGSVTTKLDALKKGAEAAMSGISAKRQAMQFDTLVTAFGQLARESAEEIAQVMKEIPSETVDPYPVHFSLLKAYAPEDHADLTARSTALKAACESFKTEFTQRIEHTREEVEAEALVKAALIKYSSYLQKAGIKVKMTDGTDQPFVQFNALNVYIRPETSADAIAVPWDAFDLKDAKWAVSYREIYRIAHMLYRATVDMPGDTNLMLDAGHRIGLALFCNTHSSGVADDRELLVEAVAELDAAKALIGANDFLTRVSTQIRARLVKIVEGAYKQLTEREAALKLEAAVFGIERVRTWRTQYEAVRSFADGRYGTTEFAKTNGKEIRELMYTSFRQAFRHTEKWKEAAFTNIDDPNAVLWLKDRQMNMVFADGGVGGNNWRMAKRIAANEKFVGVNIIVKFTGGEPVDFLIGAGDSGGETIAGGLMLRIGGATAVPPLFAAKPNPVSLGRNREYRDSKKPVTALEFNRTYVITVLVEEGKTAIYVDFDKIRDLPTDQVFNAAGAKDAIIEAMAGKGTATWWIDAIQVLTE